MTAPSPESGAINLAALWIPVVPDTSKIGDAMRHAGEDARHQFEESFASGGGSTSMFDKLTSQLGNQFSQEISAGLQRGLAGMELPAGMNRVTESLMRGFEGVKGRTEAAGVALREYERAHERLTQALDREAVAQSRLNDLSARGAQGTTMLSATAALEAAHRRVAHATEDDTAAHEQYQKVLDSGSSSLMTFAASTGIVSGAISAGITLGAEAITRMTEAAVEGFKDIVEGAESVAEKLIGVGEQFEELHRSIELSTVASGSALDELKTHSDALVSSLDTGFDKVGTDMATLASRLNMTAGPALDQLTRHVEELRDRFGALDTSALAGAFTQFQISGGQADAALASLVNTARQYGISLNGLVNDLATAGPALQEFDLTVEQSGHLLGELSAQHINASAAVNALTRAEKGAAAQHEDLKTFVQQELTIIEQYRDSNNKAAAEQEALLAFGTKNWVQATAAAKSYLETVNAGPNAYKSNSAELDHLIATTQSLENRWTALRNSMTTAFAPVASLALEGINTAVSKLGEWIQSHEGQVLDFVKRLGTDFIDAIPAVQEFVAKSLEAIEPWAKMLQWAVGTATRVFGELIGVASQLDKLPMFKHLFGDFSKELKDAADMLSHTGNEIRDFNLGGTLDGWSNSIKGFRPDIQGWTKDLAENTDALKSQLDALNNAKSAAGDGVGGAPPGDVGHIAPPASSFEPGGGGSGGDPDPDVGGADAGGADSGGGDQPGDDGGATPVQPRSWHMAPPPNDGVGGPQHVRMAGWHPRVEDVDSRGGSEHHGGGGEHGGGGRHGGLFGQHQQQRGPTNEQDRQHTRRLEDLSDKISDDSDSITDLTQAQKDAAAKLKHDTQLRDSYTEGSLAWIQANKDVTSDNKELSRTTKELNRTIRDRKRSEEDIQDENANYADKSKGRGGGKDSKSSPAQDFGSQFLSGMMSDLGLGNVFGGKSPLDWGLPKLAEGVLGWALGGDDKDDTSSSGGSGGGSSGGGGWLAPLKHWLHPDADSSGGDGGGASPFIFGDKGQAFGPDGTAPGPGQGVPHLPGAAQAPGPATTPAPPSAQHPAAPAPPPAAPPGDSVVPGAPTPTPVPTPRVTTAPTPGTHYTGFDGGGGGPTAAPQHAGYVALNTALGGGSSGGGVQTAGYTQAAGPHIAQLASAVGIPLTHNPDGTISSSNPVWQHLLQRESGGRNVRQGVVDSNTGGNEAEGFFQITPQTWRSHGGAEFAPNPMAATADQQAQIAARILQSNPSGSDWGAGSPGRENAADLLAGLGGDPGGGGGAPYAPTNFPPAALPGGAPPPGMPALDNPNSVASRVPNAPNVEAGIRRMGGLPTLYDTSGKNAYQVPAWTQQLAKDFGLTASTYASGGSLHQMGYAFDFNGPQPKMDAFADYIQQNLSPQTLQLIHASGQRRWGIASGQDVSGGGYYAGDYGGHFDHVHWATDVPPIMGDQAGPDDSIVGGASPFTPAGFRNTAAVPGGPAGPPPVNVPNVNPMTPQPHYTGPSLPGPERVSSGENVAPQHLSPAQQTGQNASSTVWGLIGSLIGNPDFNPRNWQGILHEPAWQGVQHQHQPVQSVQPVSYDHSVTINNPTVANPDALTQAMRQEQLSRYYTAAGGLPTSGIGSP